MSSGTTTGSAASGAASIISVTEVKAELDISGTAADSLLADYIDQAEAWVSAVTFRRFAAGTATRYYRKDAVRDKRLYLDEDLISVSQLVNGNGGTIDSGDYWLMPRNEGPPYQWIELKSGEVWTFDTDGEASVTGTWGYSSTPNDAIRRGMIRLVAWMYRSRPNSIGGASATLFTGDGVAVAPTSLPREIGEFVRPFRRLTRLIG